MATFEGRPRTIGRAPYVDIDVVGLLVHVVSDVAHVVGDIDRHGGQPSGDIRLDDMHVDVGSRFR